MTSDTASLKLVTGVLSVEKETNIIHGCGFYVAARILEEGSAIYSPHARFLSLFLSLISGDQLKHTNSTLYADIVPQWLSELSETTVAQCSLTCCV